MAILGSKGKGKLDISARVYRAETNTWDNLGVIYTSKVSLKDRVIRYLKNILGGKMKWRMF